ncbi:MAG: NADPH:quinone oxidoreductase family protein [Actinobacteria bacterium]|nr:NADPH:quinone oxidoreductase family protein [Actinomycetota bacterium]
MTETMTSTTPATGTMRAWRVHTYGAPLEVLTLETVEIPEPGPGEVRVAVAAIPLNLNDLERITGGNMMAPPTFPYSPGMEVFGRVDACGAGTEHLLGRRVAAITRQAHGGFAEFAICQATGVFEIPEDLEAPGAAALLFPFHLAWLGLVDRAELAAGETVLIHAGAGGSGSAAIQLAKHLGATVIATCGSAAKVQLCRELGADLVIDYTTEDVAAIVLEHTGGRGVDVVFDNVGEAVMDDSMKCIAYNGRYLMMGFASNKAIADEASIVPRRIAMGNFKLCGVLLNYTSEDMIALLKGAMGWNVAPTGLGERITETIIGLVRSGAVHPVVGSTPAFEDLPRAITDMADRSTVGRVIVTLS